VPPALVAWVRRAAAAGAHVCSVCTGHVRARRGRACSTGAAARRTGSARASCSAAFPRATVVGDRLFVEDGPIASSAGIVAGVDMALAFLERDAGPVVASSVAREMVVYLRRDAEHAQESVYLDYQTHLSPGVHLVQQHLVARPEAADTLADLARIAGMSERHLTRTFRRATGISVHAYRERLRLERARDLMRNPTMTIEAVAAACGYADAASSAACGAPATAPRRGAARPPLLIRRPDGRSADPRGPVPVARAEAVRGNPGESAAERLS
jgi:transcriptional regulator GlxA family with amidase domain